MRSVQDWIAVKRLYKNGVKPSHFKLPQCERGIYYQLILSYGCEIKKEKLYACRNITNIKW